MSFELIGDHHTGAGSSFPSTNRNRFCHQELRIHRWGHYPRAHLLQKQTIQVSARLLAMLVGCGSSKRPTGKVYYGPGSFPILFAATAATPDLPHEIT